ncbi:MAG: DivIVA domain-containing protein [Clostridia bacterium]|nr:DivIVA domain-containing protein [Clostridia bacterium]
MLTPQDIENKVFKRSFRGYDIEDVESFLQEIGDSYEKLYKENLVANDRIAMLSDAVRQYKSMEDTLQSALSTAERDGEDVKKNAQTRAEGILKDAQSQAEQLINHSEQEVARVTYQYEQMKRSVEVFRAKVVSLLHAQLDIIKDYSEIMVDEETVRDAKAVCEKALPVIEKKMEQIHPAEKATAESASIQDTTEIPVVSTDYEK